MPCDNEVLRNGATAVMRDDSEQVDKEHDKGMKKILDTVIALKKQYEFRYRLSKTAGFPDVDGTGKIMAAAELLEIFVKRELGCRMKKRAAEKAAKKESKDEQK